MSVYILAFFTALLLVIFFTPSLIKVAELKNLTDEPDEERKLHKRKIPTIGGIIIFAAMIFALSLWLSISFTDDAFVFAERFKDIKEAYEVLSNAERRKVYDFKNSNEYESSSSSSNISPEIELFISNKKVIHIGDKITFKWKTVNADVVILEPFGSVEPVGEITYKINNVNGDRIKFKLVAINSGFQIKIENEIIVNIITFGEIHNTVNQGVPEDNKFDFSHNKRKIFKSNKYLDYFFDFTVLMVSKLSLTIAFFLAVGLTVYILYIFFRIFIESRI